MKITNAKDGDLEEQATGLPDVSEGVKMFLQPMKVDVICKTQKDGYTQEESTCHRIQAVRIPLPPEQLAIKPEGQRSWRWHTLYCLTDLKLKTDDIVVIRNIRHRVVEKSNYSEYGYLEYQIVEDYQDGKTCD